MILEGKMEMIPQCHGLSRLNEKSTHLPSTYDKSIDEHWLQPLRSIPSTDVTATYHVSTQDKEDFTYLHITAERILEEDLKPFMKRCYNWRNCLPLLETSLHPNLSIFSTL